MKQGKLQPSTETVIKLGVKIVKELQLENSRDTLGRWMSHYLAELLDSLEKCSNEQKKKKIEKECCDIILRVWSQRESVHGIFTPLSDLRPLIDIIESLKNTRYNFMLPFNGREIKDPEWLDFVKLVKKNSTSILALSLCSSLSAKILSEKGIWREEFKSLISEEESKFLDKLNSLVNGENEIVFLSNFEDRNDISLEEITPEERYHIIFEKMEKEIEEQKTALLNLKNKVMSEL